MKELNLTELKELLIKKYWKNHNGDCDLKKEMERELIITEIPNQYNKQGDIVLFSVKGSPAKGEAILLKQDVEKWKGILFYIERTSFRKLYEDIEIKKGVTTQD